MEESPFWGRATAISPDSIEFLSQFEFRKGKVLVLGFELDGENLEELRGAVAAVLRDPCGYFHYTLKLSDHNQQKTLLKKLLQLR